jgi:AraC-like DNA-binding protein
MTIENIFLILIAGIGLVHGIFSALYIKLFAKRVMHNTLLTWLLLFFAYRIGKSIAMYFLDDLEFLFIFSGLGSMLAIGPLLFLYFKAITNKLFQWKNKYFIHFFPALITIIVAFYIHKGWFIPNRKYLIVVIVFLFYSQFLVYIIMSFRIYFSLKKKNKTTSYHKLSNWMKTVLFGISLIWIAYFLNIFEDSIPYISGPILYSIVIYVLTFYAVKLDVLNFNIGSLESAEDIQNSANLFDELKLLIENEEKYLNPDLNLNLLAQEFRISPHQLSKLINEHAKKNFNDFLNYYRIKKSKELLVNKNNSHLTIASLAMECGFNSLSSFNSAFKKLNSITPSAYKKRFLV